MKVGVAVLAVFVVAGCGVTVTPVEVRTAAEAPVPPLRLGESPVWSTATSGFPGRPASVQVRDGKALVVGQQGFQVIDTESGAVESTVTTDTDLGDGARWDETAGQPVLIGDGVVVPYRLDGVVELAKLVNGHDVFAADTTVGADGVLWAADDGTAMATTGQRMVAFDSRSGDHRWERAHMWPVAVADLEVLAVSGTRHDTGLEPGTTVSAFDVMTGQPTWSLVDRYAASNVVLMARDEVLVHAVAPGETTPTLVVVSLKTGEHVADLGAAVDARCATDANTTIACRTDADTLVVYDLASRQVTKLHNPENVEAVGQDRLFVGDHSIDFTGKRVDQRLPGTPVELDLHQLVVRTDDAISAYPLSEK